MSTWFRFDDALPEHPKMLGLTDRAFRVHVEAMAYCSRMRNGGLLDQRAAQRLNRYTKAVADELVREDVWVVSDGGWTIYGWEKRQRTAAEIEAIKEARREAGRKGGLRSGQSRREANEANREANAEAPSEPTSRHVTTRHESWVQSSCNPPVPARADFEGDDLNDGKNDPYALGQILGRLRIVGESA